MAKPPITQPSPDRLPIARPPSPPSQIAEPRINPPAPVKRRAARAKARTARRHIADRRPPVAERLRRQPRPAYRRHAYGGPDVYYDPRVEVIEETRINGTWVRRRLYYRPARPEDFYWRR